MVDFPLVSDFPAFFFLGTVSRNAPETDITIENVVLEEGLQLETINLGVHLSFLGGGFILKTPDDFLVLS